MANENVVIMVTTFHNFEKVSKVVTIITTFKLFLAFSKVVIVVTTFQSFKKSKFFGPVSLKMDWLRMPYIFYPISPMKICPNSPKLKNFIK